MDKNAYNILRIGLAVTFIWIGVLILRYPEAWGGYIMPWALKLMPMPLEQAMFSTAILDIIVGGFLLLNSFVWVASLVGTFHLVIVLVTSGITDITVRDIGLLAATLALMIETIPAQFIISLKKYIKNE